MGNEQMTWPELVTLWAQLLLILSVPGFFIYWFNKKGLKKPERKKIKRKRKRNNTEANSVDLKPNEGKIEMLSEEVDGKPVKGKIDIELNIHGWNNGNNWNAMDSSAKQFFLVALQEGLMLHHRDSTEDENSHTGEDPASDSRQKLLFSVFKVEEFILLIDQFYRDGENREIPIVDAYIYTMKKFQGIKKEELENYLLKLRKKHKQRENTET